MTLENNPVFTPSPLPFGAPRFDQIKIEHFKPAFEAAMRNHREAMQAIVDNQDPPTVENVLVALDLASEEIHRVNGLYNYFSLNFKNEAMQILESELSPILTEHYVRVACLPGLYERLIALQKSSCKMDAPTTRLLETKISSLKRSGATLSPVDKEKYIELEKELTQVHNDFENCLINLRQEYNFFVPPDQHALLPDSLRKVGEGYARDLGYEGDCAFGFDYTNFDLFMAECPDRELRKIYFSLWFDKCTQPPFNTDGMISKAVHLRLQSAKLLGYADYPSYAFEHTMAKSADAVKSFIAKIWPPACKKFVLDRIEIENLLGHSIEAWDWHYGAELLRQKNYQLDNTILREYLTLDKVIEACFSIAEKLFGIKMIARPDLPVVCPDVRVWEVQDGHTHKTLGLFYGDYYLRPDKSGGAWMDNLQMQHKLGAGSVPIVTNSCNFLPPASAGEPCLISWNEASTTFFHEFGHALHSLLSNVKYPSQAGTSVYTDFVELPSQLFENWAFNPEMLKKYMIHYKTGEPIPDSLITQLMKTKKFNQAHATLTYMVSVMIDLAIYADENPQNIGSMQAYQADLLQDMNLPHAGYPRHCINFFSHMMGGYACQYYSYLWSSMLEADVLFAFEEKGDMFDPDLAKSLRDNIYSVGDSRDPAESFRAFRGREPDPQSLLKLRGLIDDEGSQFVNV